MSDQDQDQEFQYELYLLGKIEAGEEDVRTGQVFTQEEVETETAKWFSESKSLAPDEVAP